MLERQSMEHNFLQFKQNSEILLIFYCGGKKKEAATIKQATIIYWAYILAAE